MIEIENIEIDDKRWRIHAEEAGFISDHLLLATINAIAREVEDKAKEFAPEGSPPPLGSSRFPGQLHDEGIIRNDAHEYSIPGGDEGLAGETVTGIHAFGGGFSVRGGNPFNRGQFSGATTTRDPGYRFKGYARPRSFIEASVYLNPAVPHARWVHEGTGIYGPHHSPIVPRVAPYLVFHWHGRLWRKKSVRGQQANPFLTNAFIYVNNIYTPAKVSELRAELAAEL